MLCIATIMLIGISMRWPFMSTGAPMFVTPDSESYVVPGWELAHGAGFNPELRRTPVYSVFIAGVFGVLGDNLERLATVQHGLGILTGLVTFSLARLIFGSLAGLIAGVAIVMSGPLLVYEHYLLSEALFTLLLAVGLLTATLGIRNPKPFPLILAGVVLALAALCRPIGQVALPIVAGLVLLSAGSQVHEGLRRTLLLCLGIIVVIAPWMVRNAMIHGTFAAEGALGQALIGRTIRHDQGFVYEDPQHPDPDPLRAAARHIIAEEAATGEPSGGHITLRIREELGISQSQTSTLLRGLALQAILERRDRFIRSTFDGARELYEGKLERLLGHWRQRTTRNWDRKWDPRVAPMVDDELPAEGPVFRQADFVVNLFQPYRNRWTITWLVAIGSVLAVAVRCWRLTLLPLLVAAGMILASAALDGPVYRYRYPVDPLLAIVAAGGIVGPIRVVWGWLRGNRSFGWSAAPVPASTTNQPGPGAPMPTSAARLPE
jgi:hypothetical protein